MLVVLLGAVVAYNNNPAITDDYLVAQISKFEHAAQCTITCTQEKCYDNIVGLELLDATVVTASPCIAEDPSQCVDFKDDPTVVMEANEADILFGQEATVLTREITLEPKRQISLDDAATVTDKPGVPTSMTFFGSEMTCEWPLEHVAHGSVTVDSSSAASGSVRARFELPVYLFLASTFGAHRADGNQNFDIAVMAARIMNTTRNLDDQPTIAPMPAMPACNYDQYVCSPGVCTYLDVNYQNFFAPDHEDLLAVAAAVNDDENAKLEDITDSQRFASNRLFGITFCGPVFGVSSRLRNSNSAVQPMPSHMEQFFPTEVERVVEATNDLKNPFAGLKVAHNHKYQLLYPAWSPVGCLGPFDAEGDATDISDNSDEFCRLEPPASYGGITNRQERTTNNLPLFTTFEANVDRAICPMNVNVNDDGTKTFLPEEGLSVYKILIPDGTDTPQVLPFSDSDSMAEACYLAPETGEFFFHCCQKVAVNYVMMPSMFETGQAALMYTSYTPGTGDAKPQFIKEADLDAAKKVMPNVNAEKGYAQFDPLGVYIQCTSENQADKHEKYVDISTNPPTAHGGMNVVFAKNQFALTTEGLKEYYGGIGCDIDTFQSKISGITTDAQDTGPDRDEPLMLRVIRPRQDNEKYAADEGRVVCMLGSKDLAQCSLADASGASLDKITSKTALATVTYELVRSKPLDAMSLDNTKTIIGWADVQLPCCPWFNVSNPDEYVYDGAETCQQSIPEIVEYAAKNPEWLAACRASEVATHTSKGWHALHSNVDVNTYYDRNADGPKTPIGPTATSTSMPIAVEDGIIPGKSCTPTDNVVTSFNGVDLSDITVSVPGVESKKVYRKAVVFNAYQGNDKKEPIIAHPEERLTVVVMRQLTMIGGADATDSILDNALGFYACKSDDSGASYVPINAWAVDAPPKTPLLASSVHPCNGATTDGYTPTTLPAFTADPAFDLAKTGYIAPDASATARIGLNTLYGDNNAVPMTSAARLMYGFVPNGVGTTTRLRQETSCRLGLHNVNPFDAGTAWLGAAQMSDTRDPVRRITAQRNTTVFCAAATLTQPRDAGDRKYTIETCTGKPSTDDTGGDPFVLLATAVPTSTFADGPFTDATSEVFGKTHNKEARQTDNCNVDTMAKKYLYDMYASVGKYAPYHKTKRSALEQIGLDLTAAIPIVGGLPATYIYSQQNKKTSKLMLRPAQTNNGIPGLPATELFNKPATPPEKYMVFDLLLNFSSPSLSIAVRSHCKVTNEVGLSPEIIQVPPSDRTSFCSGLSTKDHLCVSDSYGGDDIHNALPQDRRGPWEVATGMAEVDTDKTNMKRLYNYKNSFRAAIKGIQEKSASQQGYLTTSINRDGKDTFAGRTADVHATCGSNTPTADRPVWYKGCLLDGRFPSGYPPQPNAGGDKLNSDVLFFPPQHAPHERSADAATVGITPTWYPRARQFTSQGFAHDSSNPQPEPKVYRPFRYVLDYIMFAAPVPLASAAALAVPLTGTSVVKVPMPATSAGPGPSAVPEDYARRPYIPPTPTTCTCDRDIEWDCIREGPENWANPGYHPLMAQMCPPEAIAACSAPTGTSSPEAPPSCCSVLVKCAWSWKAGGRAIQGGVSGDVGLYIYSDRPGPILVREDDPFSKPGGAPVDDPSGTLHSMFLDNMAPQPKTLEAYYTREAVNVYSLPGACVRSPFGTLNSQLMTASLRANTFLNGTAGTVDSPALVGHEALISYCHQYAGKRFQACDGDKFTYEERLDFCTNTQHADTITVAWGTPDRRVPCYTAPDHSGAVCLYIAGDTAHTSFTSMLASVPKNVPKITIVVAPFTHAVASQLQSGMHLYGMGQDQYPSGALHTLTRSIQNFGAGTQQNALPRMVPCTVNVTTNCRQMATRSQLRIIADVQTGVSAEGVESYDAAVAVVTDTMAALLETFTLPGLPMNTSANTICSDDQVATPTARTTSHNQPVYECGPKTSFLPTIAGRRQTITRPGVTLTTVGDYPITFTPAETPHCTAIVVAGHSFTATHPLVIDQSLCEGPEAELIGVVIVGPDARNTTLAGVTLKNVPTGKAPAAVAALGYDAEFGTKTTVDVTGLVATVEARNKTYDYAFAHATADTVVSLATTTGAAPAVLIQEARSEHLPVSPAWHTFNVSNYTSVFGWGIEQRLYHQPTRRDRILHVVFAALVVIVLALMAVLLGLCVLITHQTEGKARRGAGKQD